MTHFKHHMWNQNNSKLMKDWTELYYLNTEKRFRFLCTTCLKLVLIKAHHAKKLNIFILSTTLSAFVDKWLAICLQMYSTYRVNWKCCLEQVEYLSEEQTPGKSTKAQ